MEGINTSYFLESCQYTYKLLTVNILNMEIQFIVATTCMTAIMMTQTMTQNQNKLSLTHALIKEDLLLQLDHNQVHSTYTDFSQIINVINTLNDHASALRSNIDDGLTHLKSSFSHVLQVDGINYLLASKTRTADLELACGLRGGSNIDFENIDKYQKLAEAIKLYNEANTGTSIPKIDEFIVPALNNNGKLMYIGSDKELSTDAEALNLILANDIAPRFSIKENKLIFLSAEQDSTLVCVYNLSEKEQYKSLWKTFAKRRIAWCDSIIAELVDIKQIILDSFDDNFHYSHGVKNKLEFSINNSSLIEYKEGLETHQIDSIKMNAQFSLSNIYYDNYIGTIRNELYKLNNFIGGKPKLLNHLHKFAATEVIQILNQELTGVTNKAIYAEAVKQYLSIMGTKLDRTNNVAIQQVQYYLPTMENTFQQYEIIQLPFRTETYEVMLDIPEKHLALSLNEESCSFIDDGHFHNYCTRLNNSTGTYGCINYHPLQVHNDCCLRLVQMDVQGILKKCNTAIFDHDPTLIRFDYETFTSIFIHSAIREESFTTVCENGEESHSTNETALIASECHVQYDSTKLTSAGQVLGTIITPISTLFPDQATMLLDMSDTPTKEYEPGVNPKPDSTTEDYELLGLNLYAWLAILPGGIIAIVGMVCSMWLVVLCKRKGNTNKKDKDRRGNYIMAHQSGIDQRPIYYPRYKHGPPTAPPAFEFI